MTDRCRGYGRQAARCSNKPLKGGELCHVHAPRCGEVNGGLAKKYHYQLCLCERYEGHWQDHKAVMGSWPSCGRMSI